jgi:hypothetical protein
MNIPGSLEPTHTSTHLAPLLLTGAGLVVTLGTWGAQCVHVTVIFPSSKEAFVLELQIGTKCQHFILNCPFILQIRHKV